MNGDSGEKIGPNLAKSLVALQADAKPIKANALNDFLKHNYADLPSIIREVQPLLKKHKLAVVQMPANIGGQSALRTIVLHESGEYLEDTMPIVLPTAREAEKWDKKANKTVTVFVEPTAQDQGSNITYLRRYAYMAALGLVAEEEVHLPSTDARAHMGLRNPGRTGGSSDKPVTDAQKNLILKLATEKGFTQQVAQARLAEIETSAEASVAIKTLQDMEAPK